MDFSHYVALGDSMSIDLYPALDAGEIDVAVALERDASAGRVAALGAAALFYRNDEAHWPDEIGNDLVSRFPAVEYENLAADGATIGDVFGEQLPRLKPSEEPTLLTLTIGATDLFSAFSNRPKPSLADRIAKDIAEAFEFLVDAVRRARPSSLLIVSTIYDPSDRTGRVNGIFDEAGSLQLRALDALNESIRKIATGTPGLLLGEIYGHFLGHGATAPEADRWYWRRSSLDPNARGASEIRRVWMEALTAAEVLEEER
ncbi:MAG: SGNH/GDSL hydrolase family protein [Gemmatimonadaceae bacterium]